MGRRAKTQIICFQTLHQLCGVNLLLVATIQPRLPLARHSSMSSSPRHSCTTVPIEDFTKREKRWRTTFPPAIICDNNDGFAGEDEDREEEKDRWEMAEVAGVEGLYTVLDANAGVNQDKSNRWGPAGQRWVMRRHCWHSNSGRTGLVCRRIRTRVKKEVFCKKKKKSPLQQWEKRPQRIVITGRKLIFSSNST